MKIERINHVAELQRIAAEIDRAGSGRTAAYCGSKYDTDLIRNAASELAAARERAKTAESQRDECAMRLDDVARTAGEKIRVLRSLAASANEVLERLEDVLANSEDFKVRETPAIETINVLCHFFSSKLSNLATPAAAAEGGVTP